MFIRCIYSINMNRWYQYACVPVQLNGYNKSNATDARFKTKPINSFFVFYLFSFHFIFSSLNTEDVILSETILVVPSPFFNHFYHHLFFFFLFFFFFFWEKDSKVQKKL